MPPGADPDENLAQGGYQDYSAISSTWQGDEQFARGEVSMTMYEQWMLSAAVATISPDMNFTILPIRERGSGPDGPMATFSGGNAWYITTGATSGIMLAVQRVTQMTPRVPVSSSRSSQV